MIERYCLDLPTPARGFMDSFLLGNGRLGSTVRSGIGEERFDFNLDRFWSGGPSPAFGAASPGHLLPELRQAVRSGDSARADALSRAMQGQGWTQSYQPLSGLLFGFAPSSDARGYMRRLDLANATVRHQYNTDAGDVLVSSFVSGPRSVAVTAVEGNGLLPADQMELRWDCPHPCQTHEWSEGATRWTRVVGRAPARVIPPYIQSDVAVSYGTDIPATDGTVEADMGFSVVAALQPVEGGVRLVVAAECGFRGWSQRPSADTESMAQAAQDTVRAALGVDGAQLHQEHVADHRQYFDRNDLELPSRPELAERDPARAELLYHFGRYLLIASSRPGTEPANLQGIWNPYRRPAWSSNHTTNINTEMNYWPSQVTGLGDLAGPLVDMVEELVVAGSRSARHFYGAPGSVVHHNTDLWRFSQPVEGTPMWANWTGALPWLVSHCWDHWEYGAADDDFARQRLLPMLAEIVRFALFMLVEDGTGQLVVSPSSSPEHVFVGRDGGHWGVTEGSTMDQELYRQLLERFVTLSARFGLEPELVEQARAALPRLRMPLIANDGELCEWGPGLVGGEPGHRHFSHLYGLFPAGGPTRFADPAFIDAARRSLDRRMANSIDRPGWSQSWILCMAARLGDPDLAQRAVEGLLTQLTTRSLLVLHPYSGVPDNAVFQIDGNFGATAGMLEMLVQSAVDGVLLLAALPAGWHTGHLSGARARGGHSVDVAWQDGLVTSATITVGQEGAFALDIPAGRDYEVTRQSNAVRCQTMWSTDQISHRQRLTWRASAGQSYRIAQADAGPEDASSVTK